MFFFWEFVLYIYTVYFCLWLRGTLVARAQLALSRFSILSSIHNKWDVANYCQCDLHCTAANCYHHLLYWRCYTHLNWTKETVQLCLKYSHHLKNILITTSETKAIRWSHQLRLCLNKEWNLCLYGCSHNTKFFHNPLYNWTFPLYYT